MFAIMWSIGATLELDDRSKMEAFMQEKLDLDLPVIAEESHHTIFEYFVNKEGKFPPFLALFCCVFNFNM